MSIDDGRSDEKQEREKTQEKEQVAENACKRAAWIWDMAMASCRDDNRIVLSPELLNLALQISRIGQPFTHPLFYTW